MSTFLTILSYMCCTCLGFLVGSLMRESSWESQDWQILKWNSKVMGYRPVAVGDRLHARENIVMSLSLNTEAIPAEGLLVEE
jgi:hypothetical protein